MTRIEAANYLNISLATLDRYKKAGMLRPGKAKGKTRSILVYDELELRRFKESMSSDGLVTEPTDSKVDSGSIPVSFRLAPRYVQQLRARAQAKGISEGEYARNILIRDLENDGEEPVMRAVRRLSAGLADAMYMLALRPKNASKENRRAIELHLKKCFLDETETP